MSIIIKPPDTTHMMEYKYTNSTCESLAEASKIKRMTYNQDAKTYAPLAHKT